MNTNQSYIKNHLIAYIGNKRSLTDLIEKAIKRTGVMKLAKTPSLLDLFAGSGVISRLARTMGFEVTANDWEHYSYVMNKAFLECAPDIIENGFRRLGGIDNAIDILNELTEPADKDRYISKYYCPENDERPDLKNERLFYTSYNGKRIDAIRAKIYEWKTHKFIDQQEENLLLALLIYEASTRSNTSGVFKGFHKGFGGTNGDALSRIMSPVKLKKPSLIDGPKAMVYKEDASKLLEILKDESFDIVYLDPPYNQHQYGSNYHLLNTVALNDRPPVNKSVYINGKKTNKSAIRKDWVKTRSSFCYRDTAASDFGRIIKSINSKFILLSYSTDGIISFDEMLGMLSRKGKLDIVLSEYVKYRGGKQALTTQVRNIEFVLIVDTSKKGRESDIEKIKKILLASKIDLFVKKTINPIRAESAGFSFVSLRKAEGRGNEKVYEKIYDEKNVILRISDNRLSEHNIINSDFVDMSSETLGRIYDDLEYITNLTKEDEIYITLEEIVKYYRINMRDRSVELFADIPYYLSKFNNKKAYIPALKSIISVLDMMIQTLDMWRDHNILERSVFKKFEKVMLVKLSFEPQADALGDTAQKNQNAVHEYKKRISSLYGYFVDTLEKGKTDIVTAEEKDNNMSYVPVSRMKIKKQ